MEMFHAALGQVLAFRDRLGGLKALDQQAVDAALAELNRQPQPDRATTNDGDLGRHQCLVCHLAESKV